jgi:AraC-like DNA-binding protein
MIDFICINTELVWNMDKLDELIEIPIELLANPVFVLDGTLKHHSTEKLHYHSCHQLLRVSKGIAFLVEENKKQLLFSNMTAFIPAGRPHRSTVMGEPVHYNSIFLDQALFNQDINEIVIFDLSELGMALFNRINSHSLSEYNGNGVDAQCLNLLLKLLETEINLESDHIRIPVPRNPENLKITEYIEKHFDRKMKLSDFTNVMHYSERHISRIFKEDLNLSIFEYLKLYRIFQSALKLSQKENPKTITEIAFSCGYDSMSSFYQDFRDIFSMTPKIFKQKNSR